MAYYYRWKLNPAATHRLATLVGVTSPTLEYRVLEPVLEPALEPVLDALTFPPAGSVFTPVLDIRARQHHPLYPFRDCPCGAHVRKVSGPVDHFLSYICARCEYCITNCVCLGGDTWRYQEHPGFNARISQRKPDDL